MVKFTQQKQLETHWLAEMWDFVTKTKKLKVIEIKQNMYKFNKMLQFMEGGIHSAIQYGESVLLRAIQSLHLRPSPKIST